MQAGAVQIRLVADIMDLQSKMQKAQSIVDNAAGSISKALGAAFAGFSAASFVTKLIDVQRQFDVLNSSLITVTGSSTRAAQEFAWIKEFAATTPYQLNEVTGAFVKMKALGLDASQKALASYGNTASAMGKSLNQMIEAVADAATGEFERLKEFGIKAKKDGDQVSLTFQGVTKNIGNNAAAITKYLQDIGNNEFASAMAQRAGTLDGAISNLADTWDGLYLTVNSGAVGSLIYDSVTLAATAIKSAEGAVKMLADAIVPAAKIGGAYFALFVAAPAVYAMTVAAMTPVIHATALLAYNMITGEGAAIGLNTSLYGTSVAAQLASGSLSKMALAASVLFAAFAGWQFGTYLRDQFAEVRVAGLAFVGVMLKGWEHVKYGAQLAGAAIKALIPGTESFAEAKKRLSQEHAAEIDLIDQNIADLVSYELAEKKATAAAAASISTKKAVTVASKEQIEAAKKAIEEATKTAQSLANIRNKEYDDIDAYMRAESTRLADTARASEDAVRAAQDEYDNHGKLQSAIAETTLARLQDQLVNKTAGTDAYASIARQVEAQRQLINILKNGEARDAAEDAAKELADANKKAAEDSSRYWEDALTRAFESGKSGWQSLWSTIKNTLQTQVLKIFLAPVVGGVSGMANAATGSGGASPFAAYGNPFTNFGGSMGNSIADFGTSMVDKGFTSLGTGIENLGLSLNANAPMVNAFGDALGYATALMAASDGKWGQAAGAAIGTYFGGPIGSAIGSAIGGMVDELFGGGGGPKTESGYGYSIGSPGNVDRLVGGATGSAAVYAKGIEDGWAALASKFGLASSLSVGAFTSTDPEGDALTQVQVAAGLDGQSVYSRADRLGGTANIGNVGRTPEELAAALQEESVRVLFAALKASNLDGEYTAYFASIGDSVAEMTAALDTVVLIKDFRTAMDSLPFAYLRDLSFDAAKGLLQAAGGLQAFGANLSGFYDNFYTESEKTANLTRNVTDALAAQNIVLPQVDTNLRAWYRSEVERLGAMDLSIAANAQAYASVLALQGSVAQLATGAETAAQQIAEAAARLQADIYSAQDDAMSAYMSAQADYAAIVAQEQEAAAQSMQAAAAATTQAADAIRSALASAGAGIATLIRDLTTTAGGTLDPMALARSTQAAYLDDLRRAQAGDVDASGRVASSARAYLDASGAVSTNSRQAATVAQVVRELGQLPAVKTYEQQLLEAVQGTTTAVTTSSASNASTIAAALNAKITAELTMDARSEILKIMNLVVNDENLTTEQKTLALAESNQIDKLIKLSSSNLFSSVDQQLALATTGSVVKTFTAALGAHDIDAMAIAYAQSTTIEKIIRASGGVLTLDQQMLLNGIEKYNKDIQIGIKIDSSELSTFQQTLMSIFGTIDITGLAAAGVDLSGVISNEALARLQSVSTYVRSFDWVNTDLPTRASQMHAIRTTAIAYGVSSQDVATAIGVSKSELASWYNALNVPFFATGGMHAGGLRIVGENGPELEVTGPSRIYNAADTMAMLRNPQANSAALADGLKAMAAELAAVRAELAAIKANTQAGAVHQADSADSLRKLKNNGVQVWTDPAEPLTTQATP